MRNVRVACYLQPAHLARDTRRDSHKHSRSLVRTLLKAERSRACSTLLALIVGLTLTLVCQGHIEDNHISGPHITFLGEPEHNHNPGELSVSSNDTYDSSGPGAMDYMAGMYMPGMVDIPAMTMTMYIAWQSLTPPAPTSTTATNSIGGNIANAIPNIPLENVTLATLSFTLLLWMLWRDPNFSTLATAAIALRRSQTNTRPEPPPPRLSPC